MEDQKKKDQNVKFKKSAIDFKAINSTNYPSLTSEDETIRSTAVNTKISHCTTNYHFTRNGGAN
jgi:hypothetical protein